VTGPSVSRIVDHWQQSAISVGAGEQLLGTAFNILRLTMTMPNASQARDRRRERQQSLIPHPIHCCLHQKNPGGEGKTHHTDDLRRIASLGVVGSASIGGLRQMAAQLLLRMSDDHDRT
jgi:hypothetical protein